MFNGILLFIFFGAPESSYDITERYNDSLLVYNTYQSQIELLKTVKETERERWYQQDATTDRLTACAKVRLKKYNHQDYKPVTTFERVGMGVAYAYPKPGNAVHTTPEAFSKGSLPKYHFVVYDKQTRFFSEKNCALRIPYILKMVFDKGRLLFMDKLNPVTLQKLEAKL